MRIADADIVLIPGLGGAPEGHWQQRWALRFPNAQIVAPPTSGGSDAWQSNAVAALQGAAKPVVVVAHALGVSLLVTVAPKVLAGKIRGALLVAPISDEARPDAKNANIFGPLPRDPLPFASLLVASTDDPLLSPEQAADLAGAWGAELHLAGPAGRIDLGSGHGPWPEGLLMFTRLMQRI